MQRTVCIAVLVILLASLGNAVYDWQRSGCELKTEEASVSVSTGDNSNCMFSVGTQKHCKSTSNCVSLYGLAASSSAEGNLGPPPTNPLLLDVDHADYQVGKSHPYCQVETSIVSGSISGADIRARPGCSAYQGNEVRYKYVSATDCLCAHDYF